MAATSSSKRLVRSWRRSKLADSLGAPILACSASMASAASSMAATVAGASADPRRYHLLVLRRNGIL